MSGRCTLCLWVVDAGVTLQCGWHAREAAVFEGDWHGARASCSQHSALASVVVLGRQAQHEAQVQLSAVADGRECADSLHLPCVLFAISASEVHTTCLHTSRDCVSPSSHLALLVYMVCGSSRSIKLTLSYLVHN